jgi:ATP-dependent protease ClpP protease subunit
MVGLDGRVTDPPLRPKMARVLRHLQDTANGWLQECSNMTKEQIDQAIKKKEMWINGKRAVELGFADGFVSK